MIQIVNNLVHTSHTTLGSFTIPIPTGNPMVLLVTLEGTNFIINDPTAKLPTEFGYEKPGKSSRMYGKEEPWHLIRDIIGHFGKTIIRYFGTYYEISNLQTTRTIVT